MRTWNLRFAICLAVISVALGACGSDESVGGPSLSSDTGTNDDGSVGALDASDGSIGTDGTGGGTDTGGSTDTGGGTDTGDGTDTVQPEDTAGQDTVQPEDTAGQDTVQPEDIAGQDTVQPEDTAGQDTVQPEDTAGQDTVQPEDTAGQDTVQPEDTAGQDTVQPEDTAGDTSTDDTSTGCQSDSECAAVVKLTACKIAVCDAGTCKVADDADGTACDDGSACTDKDSCLGGSCGGEAIACDDGNPCTLDGCDDATGKCTVAPGTDGDGCDDGDLCTDNDACKEGKCVGAAKTCDDGNPCTDDSCVSDKGCVVKANEAPCGDTDKCVGAGQCKDGACEAGTKVGCDDGNPCTDDSCDSGTGKCIFAPNTLDCDDGDKCTTGDKCSEGACKPAKNVTCDDKNPCTDDACVKTTGLCESKPKVEGVACDDGDACTEGDLCGKDGTCKAGGSKTCTDDNPCTDDACDPKKGCTFTPNTAGCSGDACKLGTCDAGSCKLSDKAGCDDGNPCTTDTCDDKAGECVFTPVADSTVCGDGDKCTGKSTCQKGVCEAGAKVDCDDGNPCTDDACDLAIGCKWGGNTAPCDDGDKCTSGSACKNGSCGAGTAIDVAKICNDNNPCTDDACDPKTGCTNAPNDKACDDGNVCTENDACKDSKCTGGATKACDDGKACTNDICDPKSGGCSWTANTGACDDGDACTEKDACAAGKCAGTALSCDDGNACTTDSCDKAAGCKHENVADSAKQACDDGSKCTKDDVCVGGQCKGGGAPACDDGNACTNDTCDKDTGGCSFLPNTGPCDSGDLCTYGDTCKNGKCITSTTKSCDDGTTCTTDSCDPKTGACKFTPVADDTPCQDAFECTAKETCKAGKCTAGDTSKCALFSDTFECADAGKGWSLDTPNNKKVLWKVDNAPSTNSQFGCNLNFNDGTDYCDQAGNGCQTPTGNATSPVIDGTQLKSAARIRFNVYYDLDMCNGGLTDRPQVQILAETGNTVITSFIMQKTNQSQQWRLETRSFSQLKGQKFRIRFNLANPSGWCGNQGKGYFVDNLIVDDQITAEVCDDGVDNDGNGQVDCADIACKGKGACVEVCDDGKDNDFDDAVDCADSDCKSALACSAVEIAKWDFDCGDTGWTFTDMNRNNVKWAIDATPATPAPYTGKCTMNFNNGTNFCGTGNCSNWSSSNSNAGAAAWGQQIDATGFSKVTAVYYSWVGYETNNNAAAPFDQGSLQASTDNFALCCAGTTQCPNPPGPNNTYPSICNTNGTATYLAPRTQADAGKWVKVTADLSKFAGKKFNLRYRFSSIDQQQNSGKGWFVDDLIIYGQK